LSALQLDNKQSTKLSNCNSSIKSALRITMGIRLETNWCRIIIGLSPLTLADPFRTSCAGLIENITNKQSSAIVRRCSRRAPWAFGCSTPVKKSGVRACHGPGAPPDHGFPSRAQMGRTGPEPPLRGKVDPGTPSPPPPLVATGGKWGRGWTPLPYHP